MPRTANVKDGKQLIARAKTEADEESIKYFKRVCVQDGLDYGKEILKMIEVYWKKVHPPPGNPQLQIIQFNKPKKSRYVVCEVVDCNCRAVFRVSTVFAVKSVKMLCRKHTIQFERRGEVRGKKEL